ncbi:MAG: hypothetical protein LBE91_10265 [Tannerella sp.]|jgi:hypothetical protein|nr:hypothetical protein [Tannerella sp.]
MNILLVLAITATCPFWRDLGVSALGSTIPMLLVAIWGYLQWYKPYHKFKKMGVVKIFKNQQDAESDIKKNIKSSRNIKVYALRGNTFSLKNNQDDIATTATAATNIKQQYLISDPDNAFIEIRANEITSANPTEPLRKQIENSIEHLEIAKRSNPRIDIRKHKEYVRHRLILLDNCLYLSNLEEGKSRGESPILKIKNNSSFYNAYMKEFNDLWKKYEN